MKFEYFIIIFYIFGLRKFKVMQLKKNTFDKNTKGLATLMTKDSGLFFYSFKGKKGPTDFWPESLFSRPMLNWQLVSLLNAKCVTDRVARPLVFLSKVFFLNCITLNFLNPKIPKNIKNDNKILKFHVYKREYNT